MQSLSSPSRIYASWVTIALCFLLTGCQRPGSFFTVSEVNGTYWLVAPDGELFFSRGVNEITIGAKPQEIDENNPGYSGLKQYSSLSDWTKNTLKRIESWGFNTLGPWTTREAIEVSTLPYTLALMTGEWVGAPWEDMRSPTASRRIDRRLEKLIRYRDDPRLIGYFIDNEVGWWDETLFLVTVAKPSTDRLKRELWEMLNEAYQGDLSAFRKDFSVKPTPSSFQDLRGALSKVELVSGRRPVVVDEFVGFVADDYYRVLTEKVRQIDPNHLILCDRYASYYSQPVVRAAGRYCDVISTNYNTFSASGWVSPFFFEGLHQLSGRPILVSEFYFSAMENRTGNLNSQGPFKVVASQSERATGAAEMAEYLARLPYVVGYHWFRFADDPPRGLKSGEDFNFGLVDTSDRPYQEVTAALRNVNAHVEDLHRAGPRPRGLRLIDGAWSLPQAPGPIAADGDLDDWQSSASWVPEIEVRGARVPCGDFYITWSADELAVSAVYANYFEDKLQPDGELDSERLAVTVKRMNREAKLTITRGREEGPNIELAQRSMRVSWNGDLSGGQPRDVLLLDALMQPPIDAALADSEPIKRIEVSILAEVLGGTPFREGEELELGLQLSLKGEKGELTWPSGSTTGADGPPMRAKVRLSGAITR
jgi:hypothetical protein